MGRDWTSPTGNFHGSTGVTLEPGDPPAPSLALVAAVALHDAVVDASNGSVRPTIKWPNDLLIGPAKLAGILLERAADQIVVGIGVNLATAPEVAGRDTTALAAFGTSIGTEVFAARLAPIFASELALWRENGLPPLIARWTERAHPRGARLTISEGVDAGLTGAFDSLDPTGALRLRLDDGALRLVTAGEVRYAH